MPQERQMKTKTKNPNGVFCQICVKLPPDVKRDAKMAGINMTATCRDALEAKIRSHKEGKKR